ncbi:cytochrome P450 [Actinomadura sp. KC06]|uniref:cytochrome P450 n=1 Tax=Actinomadura sp. KC06 TaxID=2530369 RepID=UPI001052E6A5|nr:cytochrome P450 [Actinomadura sp. KC06]TDD33100.1 cytochrome P450 [Actinomadura sp. KC06]
MQSNTEKRNDAEVDRLAADFDHHDEALDHEVLTQVYDRLLAGCPVARTTAHDGFALITRHADVVEVEKDGRRFSCAQGVVHPRHAGQPPNIPIEFDGPLHTAYRKLFMEVLKAPRVRRIEPYLRDLTERVLDSFAGGDDADFVQNVAVQIPVRAVGHLLGFGEDANEQLQEFATAILEHAGTPAMADAVQKLGALTSTHLNQRREEPRGDYLSTLVQADFGDRPLTDDELLGIIRSFVFAGFETTSRSIASLVHHLVTHPELQTRMRSDTALIEGIVEEGLRLFPPVHTMFRTVTEPTELRDAPLAEGERLVLLYGAANRDPEQFEDPTTFRVDRANARQHLAFGIGAHFCAGAPLARAEMRILMEALVERPPLELVGVPRHLPHLMMGQMMGIDYLPLRFQGDD